MPLLGGQHSAVKPRIAVSLAQQVAHGADIHFHWVQGTDGQGMCLWGTFKNGNYNLGLYLSPIQ